MGDQVTSLSFFSFEGFGPKWWGFKMMQFAHAKIGEIEGIEFYKLMGSGKGDGFNPWPDFSTYALLIVWENETSADKFIDSQVFKDYQSKASSIHTYFLRNLHAHGTWSGSNPFRKTSTAFSDRFPIAVITRATIKLSKLRSFWKYVPTSSKPIADQEGLLFTKGIGEVPVTQMATFSVWNSIEDVKKYAYQSKEHKKAIEMTRNLKWYKEELFSRFIVEKEDNWQAPK